MTHILHTTQHDFQKIMTHDCKNVIITSCLSLLTPSSYDLINLMENIIIHYSGNHRLFNVENYITWHSCNHYNTHYTHDFMSHNLTYNTRISSMKTCISLQFNSLHFTICLLARIYTFANKTCISWCLLTYSRLWSSQDRNQKYTLFSDTPKMHLRMKFICHSRTHYNMFCKKSCTHFTGRQEIMLQVCPQWKLVFHNTHTIFLYPLTFTYSIYIRNGAFFFHTHFSFMV
jgi:hypothetical protein